MANPVCFDEPPGAKCSAFDQPVQLLSGAWEEGAGGGRGGSTGLTHLHKTQTATGKFYKISLCQESSVTHLSFRCY